MTTRRHHYAILVWSLVSGWCVHPVTYRTLRRAVAEAQQIEYAEGFVVRVDAA